jgi:undecaprenyl pyrophosphate phosphatase UppP
VICALLLMFVASFGAFDSNAWVEGSRYQLTLILVGFVLGTISCFAVVYALLSREDHHAFNQPVEGVAAFYFSAYVWASGGLGDIIPVSSAARMITVCELYLGLATILVVLGTAVSRAFGRKQKFLLVEETDEGGRRSYRFRPTESPDAD